MMGIDLNELAERVKGLAAPCRETDLIIAAATGFGTSLMPLLDGDNIAAIAPMTPAYTASLDAAMTLVPRGWQWSVQDYAGGAPAIGIVGNKMFIRNAATPALALTAAALRARAGAA